VASRDGSLQSTEERGKRRKVFDGLEDMMKQNVKKLAVFRPHKAVVEPKPTLTGGGIPLVAERSKQQVPAR